MARVKLIELHKRFRKDFERLIKQEELDKLDKLMVAETDFEEVPLYSRYSQLSFLGELSPLEKNRELIRAAASYLPRITEHARKYYSGRDYDFFGMISVTDWEGFPNEGLITPNFWITNLSRGLLNHLQISPPNSPYSDFVAESLDHHPSYEIGEGLSHLPGGPYIERVYVRVRSADDLVVRE